MNQYAVAKLLRAELIARALFSWEIYRRLLPKSLPASDELIAQLKSEVSTAVDNSLPDIIKHYDRAVQYLGTTNTMPPLSELVETGNQKVGAAIDEFFVLRSESSEQPAAITSFMVDPARLEELRAVKSPKFDLTRLLALCEELNLCYANRAYMAVAALTRALLDHVPPIFGHASFKEVANNYAGARSFRESMQHLEGSARKVGDAHLHVQIRPKEVLPNATQVNFASDLDVLLAEIVRLLS